MPGPIELARRGSRHVQLQLPPAAVADIILLMLDAPRQRWDLLEEARSETDTAWLRSLTPETGFQWFLDLHGFARSLPMSSEEQERLRAARWEEKLALRRKEIAAFAALDRLQGHCPQQDEEADSSSATAPPSGGIPAVPRVDS